MTWVDNGAGGWYWEPGEGEGWSPPDGTSAPAYAPPSSRFQNVGSAAPTNKSEPRETAIATREASDAYARSAVDPSSPNYRGDGWTLRQGPDGLEAVLTTDIAAQTAQNKWANAQSPTTPMPDIAGQTQQTLDSLFVPTGPNRSTQHALAAFQPTAPSVAAPRQATSAPAAGGAFTGRVSTQGINAQGLSNTAQVAAPGAQAPTIDRERIDALTGGLNTYQTALWEMAQDNTGLSAAEAMLQKASSLAQFEAANATRQAQRGALGQARSARNRGDRALLEQQAIGDASYLGTQAAFDAAKANRQTTFEIAELRAKEEAADKDFRFNAIKEAANLGLNTAALELDISKADLDSATNWINQEFAREGLQLQLDQAKTEQILGFTRDMAALQFQYDQMNVADQQETARLLMQKYQIDQNTWMGLQQIKASKQFDWSGVATALIGGAASGATAAIAKSDVNAKTNIETASADDLDDFMRALGAHTYEYKEPKLDGEGLRFGFMAQELERSRLGKHMVKADARGAKVVEIAPLALATASALSVVAERLEALEQAVKS